jgi:hypothetical protein
MHGSPKAESIGIKRKDSGYSAESARSLDKEYGHLAPKTRDFALVEKSANVESTMHMNTPRAVANTTAAGVPIKTGKDDGSGSVWRRIKVTAFSRRAAGGKA